MAVIGIVYPSLITIRQTYFKRIIAYATIAHMNLVMLDIFSFNSIGLEKAVLQSLSHGFVASPLFLIIGVVYDRHGRRMIKYYGDFAHLMPVYVFIFIFLV
jgi:NADH:ubiquinone oxidoreductase subunit 4 (subunit M)